MSRSGIGAVSVCAACAMALLPAPAHAQNHPELHWLTVETPHFIVHYHEGADHTARAAAGIAEAVYPRVTGFYGWEPSKKTHLILADYEDYANGSAYFFDGKMAIWATNLEFDLRGTTQWLWNVITHEFTHMINIQSSQRTPRHVPAIYFQLFDYEKERRTDVLTGYPNTLVSYPISGVNVPAWFAEGTAQYMAPDVHLDYWDAHRDMVVRMAALGDRILPYDQMSLFKGSLASEQVYDHGFSLVRYIVRTHGPEALPKIIDELRKPTRLSAEGAFKAATGESGKELYEAWKADTRADALAEAARLGDDRREGRPFGTEGTYNVRPKFSPDGRRLAWLSNGGSPFHRTSIVMRSVDPADSADAETESLVPGATGDFCWSPDGKAIYFARRESKDRFGAVYFDLFSYDIEQEEETRLTRGARLRDPAVSPDGAHLVAVRNQDGTNDLAIVELPAEEEAAKWTVITKSPFGRQYYSPRWLPGGEAVLVDMFDSGGDFRLGETRDLVILPATPGAEPIALFASDSDDRMPVVTPDGERVLFVTDAPHAGFRKFDVVAMPLETAAGGDAFAALEGGGAPDENGHTPRLVTNAMGGAFYPALSPDGKTLAYSNYTAAGYRIHILSMDEAAGTRVSDFTGLERPPTEIEPRALDWEPSHYSGKFARFLLAPRLVIDEGRVKAGLYGSTGDVLDKQSMFGGFAFGQKGDLDAFVIYENRFWWPTLFLEGFWVRKNREDTSRFKFEGLDRDWDLDLRYDAFEVDAGVRLEAGSPYSPYFYRELAARYRYSRNHLNLKVTDITPSDDLTEDGLIVLPKDGWDYYRAHDAILSFHTRSAARRVDAEINPVGREISLAYTWSHNDLSTSGDREVDDTGVVRTLFDTNDFHQLEGSIIERRALPWLDHTLALRLAGGWIDRKVDDFFWFRIGSRPGLRGYTYYSIEGRAYATGRATYRFPILGSIDKRFLQLTFERLYGGVFYEAGLAWKSPVLERITLDQVRGDVARDVGFELRLDLVSFYTFPARIHFEGAYPLDRVEIPVSIADQDADASDDTVVLTEKDWKFYFGVLFGY